MTTTVYTDGACKGNPGPGGWAWVVPDGDSDSGAEPATTNQRMELTAAWQAISSIAGPLVIVSDSTYLVNCFRDEWWKGWIARGWINSQRKPVANRDLWEPIVDAFRTRPIRFEWVKGHAGNRWNDLADQLAVAAAESVARPTGTAGPAGYRIWVGGLRSDELGGYDETFLSAQVRNRLTDILSAKRQMHPDLVVVTGLDLGTETIAAQVATQIGVPFEVIQPFPGFGSKWPAAARQKISDLRGKARRLVTVGSANPANAQEFARAMQRRDQQASQTVDEAILVWDGSSPTVAATIKRFRQSLGEESVWVSELA